MSGSLRSLFRWVVFCYLAAWFMGVIVNYLLIKPIYSSTAYLSVIQADGANDFDSNDEISEEVVDFFNQQIVEIRSLAWERFKGRTRLAPELEQKLGADYLKERVNIRFKPESGLIAIEAQGPISKECSDIANSFAQALALHFESQKSSSERFSLASLQIAADAHPSEVPISPKRSRNIRLSGLGGILFAVGSLAFLAWREKASSKRAINPN